jgi:hypothetical protein
MIDKEGRGDVLSGPVLRVHRAVLRVRHTVVALHISVGKAALAPLNITRTSVFARSNAAVDVETAIGPIRHTHVSLLAKAVKGRLDGSTVLIGLDGVASGDGGKIVIIVSEDVLDVAVAAGHDDIEILASLASVQVNVGSDSASPQITLDMGGTGRVHAAWARFKGG